MVAKREQADGGRSSALAGRAPLSDSLTVSVPDPSAASDAPRQVYLTTREVADLLRVKERKIYDLVAAEEIPYRRVTGKLLFSRAEIIAWIEGDRAFAAERPAILVGSHDPLLEWAVRESGSGMASLFNGSLDGLERFIAGDATAAGLHLPEADGWNVETVAQRGPDGAVLIEWARRARGLILRADLDGEVRGLADLRGRRIARRQPGAGAAALFERLCAAAGLGPDEILSTEAVARTESDAAAAVGAGEADAALGVAAMARQFGLPFAPLLEERFDLLVERRAYFLAPMQQLLGFTRGAAFAAKAAAMGGYDLTDAGAVRWVSR